MKPLVVIWSNQAWSDLDKIYDFIAKDSQIQAEKQVFRILDRGEQLSTQPFIGQIQLDIDPKLEARYLVQDNYKIIYFVDELNIIVDTIFDTHQDLEKLKPKG